MPLREGRQNSRIRYAVASSFLLTPLREGRLVCMSDWKRFFCTFLLTPLREGRPQNPHYLRIQLHFYSRPCGRGDPVPCHSQRVRIDFYSRPCGRGDNTRKQKRCRSSVFLLTPLREGRQLPVRRDDRAGGEFLLTPLREGRRSLATSGRSRFDKFLLTPLREGRLRCE